MDKSITHEAIGGLIRSMEPQTILPPSTNFFNRPAQQRHAGAYGLAIDFLQQLDSKNPYHPLDIQNGRLTHGDFSARIADISGVRQETEAIRESFYIKPGAGTYTIVKVALQFFSICLLYRGAEYRIPVIVHPDAFRGDNVRSLPLRETLEAYMFGLIVPMTGMFYERIKNGEYITIDGVHFDPQGMTFTSGLLWGKKTHKLGYKDVKTIQDSSWLSACLRVESVFNSKVHTNIRYDRWNGPLTDAIIMSFVSGHPKQENIPLKYRATGL